MKTTNFFSFGLYLLLSFQTIFSLSVSGIDIKPYHLLFALCAFVFLFRLKISKPILIVYVYILFILFISLISYGLHDFNSFYINYLFCLVVVVASSAIFSNRKYIDVLRGVQIASFFITIISSLNIIINYEAVLLAHAMKVESGARPYLSFSIYGGGVNLEATWVALSTAFFVRERKFFILYFLLAFFVSYAFMSRAGILACLFVAFCWGMMIFRNIRYKKVIFLTFILLLISSILLIFLFFSDLPIISRFANIGSEPGSLGRLSMWKHVPNAIMESPLVGYGAGNSIESIRNFGFNGYEDNVHNYLIHNFLEFGFFGPILWIVLCYFYIFKFKRLELNIYISCFFLLSLLQFRGAEAIFYFIITSFVVSKEKNYA